jgi:hypothetical protein
MGLRPHFCVLGNRVQKHFIYASRATLPTLYFMLYSLNLNYGTRNRIRRRRHPLGERTLF